MTATIKHGAIHNLKVTGTKTITCRVTYKKLNGIVTMKQNGECTWTYPEYWCKLFMDDVIQYLQNVRKSLTSTTPA